MSPDLKRELRNGQELAALCHKFATDFARDGEDLHAAYWRSRAKTHYARCRSMMNIESEDYAHG